MRTGFSFIESPAGFAATASKLRPLSTASFCTIAAVDGLAGMYIVPAGYWRPLAVTGDFNQYTSSVAVNRLLKANRSEEHTSELQSRRDLVCRLLLEKKKK